MITYKDKVENRDNYCYSKWKQLSHETKMNWSLYPDKKYYGKSISWYLERDGKVEFKDPIPIPTPNIGKTEFDYGVIEDRVTGRLTIREEKKMRIVRVFILDQDEDVPVEDRVVFDSGEIITEDCDSDILLSLNMNTEKLLTAQNEKRATILDPELTAEHGKDVFLPKIKFKDLSKKLFTVQEL